MSAALEVGAVNPLVLEPAEGERVSAAFGQVAARLPDRQSLQFYVQGTPLALDELLAEETHHCEQAAGAGEDVGEHERAQAIRRLGIAQEQSIRTRRADGRAACASLPRRLPVAARRAASRSFARGRALRVKADAHERARRDSLRHAEGVRADLEAMGVPASSARRAPSCSTCCTRRFDPDAAVDGRGCPRASCHRTCVAPPTRARRAGGGERPRAAAGRGDLHRAGRPL